MIDHELTDIYQEPEDDRGTLMYMQEYGYKPVVMTVSVTPDEQSHVISHIDTLLLAEEGERFQGADFYFFTVPDDARLHLIIETPAGRKEAWYTITPHDVIAHPSPLTPDITRADESNPFAYACTQEAFDEALTYFADKIPA